MRYYLMVMLVLMSVVKASALDRNPDEFHALDSIVKEVGPMPGAPLFDIIDSVTKTCTDERTGARAIYDWIAYNIAYDCVGFHHKGKENTNIGEILANRTATCNGYAMLFNAMCDRKHITCKIIPGYARSSASSIGKKGKKKVDHAWNAVNIANEWYLVDACWAAGTTDRKTKHFSASYNDNYFFPDPERFAYTHYPANRKWQLQDAPLSRSKFNTSPMPLGEYINSDLITTNQAKGIIRGRPGDCKRIILTVKDASEVSDLSLQYKNEPLLKKTKFYVIDNQIFFDLEMPKKGKYPVQLYLNNEPIVAFVCEVKKKKK